MRLVVWVISTYVASPILYIFFALWWVYIHRIMMSYIYENMWDKERGVIIGVNTAFGCACGTPELEEPQHPPPLE